jgi:hypothetical protein
VSPYQNSPDWNKAIDDIRKGVSGEIAAMLKKKCSKTVKVTVTNGEQTNSQTFSTAPTDWQWPINPK